MKLIKITAVWCLSCLYMNEQIRKIEATNQYNYKSINLDYDNDQEAIIKYKIGKTLPVYILLNQEGQEIKRLIGEKTKEEIMKFLEGATNEK